MATINVKFYCPSGQSTIAAVDSNLRYVKNFTIKEMANNLAKESVKLIIDDKVELFAKMVQEFRNWYQKPMTVNSWYRTASFNSSPSVNGDPRSAHLHATALDWGIKGLTDQQRTNIINKWRSLCDYHGVIGAINLYTNGIHFEIYSDLWYGQTEFKVRDYRGKKGDW